MKSTRAARDLIKAHEPFLGEAQRRGRRWLVGYGHSAAAKEGVTLSRENAELLLIYDVLQAEQAVEAAAGADLPAPMRDALVSFAASVGANAFKVSDVARLTRASKHREAAAALETWVRAEEDGRLVVSERLVRRRAAEKALYLTGLDAPVSPAEPEPAPPAQADPAPRLGPLVEVDIAFEDAPAEAAALDAPAAESEPGAETEPEGEGPDEAAAESEPAAEVQSEPAAEPEAAPQHPAAQAARTEQDGAVQAVLARMAASMAGDAARSASTAQPAPDAGDDVSPGPVTGAGPEDMNAAHGDVVLHAMSAPSSANPLLGFSFLTPAIISAPMPSSQPEPEPAAGPVHQPAPDAGGPESHAPSEPAPPHPGEAPARAAGLSGEVEGPERPEGELSDAVHDDDTVLDPVLVAGPEAVEPRPETLPAGESPRGGIKIFIANLGVGLLMAGLGAADLIANFASYQAEGIGSNFVGPVVFSAGVLLAVASGVTLAGRLKERRGQRA
ncbi:MAG: glycoside hydrolase family protein [Oceanicaulis sp.]